MADKGMTTGMIPELVLGVDWFIKKTRAAYVVLSFTGVHHLRSGLKG
jgi:hypothetical protein